MTYYLLINSWVPGFVFEQNFQKIFKSNFMIDIKSIYADDGLKCVIWNLNDKKSKLVQVMAWCLDGTKPLPGPILILINNALFFLIDSELTLPDPLTLNWVIHLTHCGLVLPYGNRDLGQHWVR